MSVMPPSPLSYTGVVAVPSINKTFDPTSHDAKFTAPTIWMNTDVPAGYILGRNIYIAGVRTAQWLRFAGPYGNVEGVLVDTFTAPGTNPVVSTVINDVAVISITGGQVAAGTTTNIIRTTSLAASSLTIQIQRSTAETVSTVGSNGVSHFNGAHFSVDGNGFVNLLGGGQAIDGLIPNSGTSPVTPDVNGDVKVQGTGSLTTIGSPNTLLIRLTGLTQYAVVCGGDPSNGSLQSVSGLGTTGQVLTSNRASQYPTWQNNTPSARTNQIVITATGTYTPTSGMVYCSIEVLGGGGAGGGASGSGDPSFFSGGSGGGGGEYARAVYSAATIGASQSVTIGAGGTAVNGANGGNGSSSSVGSLISCGGGGGGMAASASLGPGSSGGAAGTGGSTASQQGNPIRTPGNVGEYFNALNAIGVGLTVSGGRGSGSQYGGMVQWPGTSGATGNNGTGYGSGGSGTFVFSSATPAPGGNGAPGVVIIMEYF